MDIGCSKRSLFDRDEIALGERGYMGDYRMVVSCFYDII